eukprot:768556-Hanusia_phi.AAC.4
MELETRMAHMANLPQKRARDEDLLSENAPPVKNSVLDPSLPDQKSMVVEFLVSLQNKLDDLFSSIRNGHEPRIEEMFSDMDESITSIYQAITANNYSRKNANAQTMTDICHKSNLNTSFEWTSFTGEVLKCVGVLSQLGKLCKSFEVLSEGKNILSYVMEVQNTATAILKEACTFLEQSCLKRGFFLHQGFDEAEAQMFLSICNSIVNVCLISTQQRKLGLMNAAYKGSPAVMCFLSQDVKKEFADSLCPILEAAIENIFASEQSDQTSQSSVLHAFLCLNQTSDGDCGQVTSDLVVGQCSLVIQTILRFGYFSPSIQDALADNCGKIFDMIEMCIVHSDSDEDCSCSNRENVGFYFRCFVALVAMLKGSSTEVRHIAEKGLISEIIWPKGSMSSMMARDVWAFLIRSGDQRSAQNSAKLILFLLEETLSDKGIGYGAIAINLSYLFAISLFRAPESSHEQLLSIFHKRTALRSLKDLIIASLSLKSMQLVFEQSEAMQQSMPSSQKVKEGIIRSIEGLMIAALTRIENMIQSTCDLTRAEHSYLCRSSLVANLMLVIEILRFQTTVGNQSTCFVEEKAESRSKTAFLANNISAPTSEELQVAELKGVKLLVMTALNNKCRNTISFAEPLFLGVWCKGPIRACFAAIIGQRA